MTYREAAIVSAYTGVLIGPFPNMCAYAQTVLHRKIGTAEMGTEEFAERLSQAAKLDFLELDAMLRDSYCMTW